MTWRTTIVSALIVIGSSLLACGGGESSIQDGLPAASRGAFPDLVVDDDSVSLTWLDVPEAGSPSLKTASWRDGTWQEPETIVESTALFVNWADAPRFHAGGRRDPVAAWLERNRDSPYAYDLRVARRGAAGWEAHTVHDDRTPTEHGFVSLVDEGDAVGIVWLDGRLTVREGGPTRLMYRRLDDGGLSPEVVLDGDVCTCCPTDAVATDGTIVVAYRDRHEGELRDISIVRRVGGTWQRPQPVDRSGWQIAGCPVNGPALAADGERIALVWFTRADGEAHILAAMSADQGATFQEPIRLDVGDPLGRVDVSLTERGEAVAVWLESAPSARAEIRLRTFGRDDDGPGRVIATTSAGRESGFPRLRVHRGRALVAWTEPVPRPHVRLADVPL